MQKVSHASDFIPNKEDIEVAAESDANNPIYLLIGFSNIYVNRKIFEAQKPVDIKRKIFCDRYNITPEMTFTTLMENIWDRMISMGLTSEMVFENL